MLPRLSGFFTCYNDVIDVGKDSRLFALGTDMDREHLHLSHMRKVRITYKYVINVVINWACPKALRVKVVFFML